MRPIFHATRNKDGVAGDQMITGGRQRPLGTRQDVHEVSTVQNYDIGTRLVMDDRVFRYCKAKTALVPLKGGCGDVMPREGNTAAVAYEVGSFTITIPENPNGPDYAAEAVAGYWNEGFIWIQVSPAPGQMHRIKSSAAASGGFITLTLYEALKVRVPASTWITAWANPYGLLIPPSGGKLSIIAEPLVVVPQNSFFWGQTNGPIFGQLNATAMGRASGDRTVFFASDGSVMSSVDVDFTAGNALPQIAGFLITNTAPWTNAGGNPELGGDQFYMLQLAP